MQRVIAVMVAFFASSAQIVGQSQPDIYNPKEAVFAPGGVSGSTLKT